MPPEETTIWFPLAIDSPDEVTPDVTIVMFLIVAPVAETVPAAVPPL